MKKIDRFKFIFENNVEVTIDTSNFLWEYCPLDEQEDYMSGSYKLDDETEMKVIDYDGVYELPQEVVDAMVFCGYDVSEL